MRKKIIKKHVCIILFQDFTYDVMEHHASTCFLLTKALRWYVHVFHISMLYKYVLIKIFSVNFQHMS